MAVRESSSVSTRDPPPGLPDVERHVADAAALLKALANEQRLHVLCVLLDGPLSVGGINARVPLSQSALSQHLAVLREAGIVRSRRESRTVRYELAPGPAEHVMRALHAAFCAPETRTARGADRAPDV